MDFFLVILSTILIALFTFLRYKFLYWQLRGVKQLKTHFFFGNFFHLRTIHLSELLQEVYDDFKGKVKFAGAYVYAKPILVILDLELVKTILITDFNKFVDRLEYRNEEKDPLSAHLGLLHGEKWRNLRSKLTPTFTSSKMKGMLSTVVEVAKELEAAFQTQLRNVKYNEVDIYDFVGRYTTDVIGTCAFGIECNSLKDPNVKFRRIGRRIFFSDARSIRWKLFLTTYANYVKVFGVRRFAKDIEKFIIDVVKDTVTTRERENIKRNDFIDLLIELKNSKNANGMPALNLNQMAAQVCVFFAAGFETSSSNMSYGLYELAKNPEIQAKLREEILSVLEKYDGLLTYEAMMEMTYLDQVISETLRKYPALASLTRIAGENYVIPGTNIVLEEGTNVYIPAKAIHYDPEIYDNPHEFRPERFAPAEVQKRHAQCFLGFGGGPRNCIGLRFGRMQVRVGLIMLLKSFKFSLSNKTSRIQISDRSSVLAPKAGVWLKVEKL